MHRFKHRSDGGIPESDEQSTRSIGHYYNPAPQPQDYRNNNDNVIDDTPMAPMASCRSTGGIMTSTCFDIPGHSIETGMGTIYGMSVRSRGLFPVVGASLKTLTGGDIGTATKLVSPLSPPFSSSLSLTLTLTGLTDPAASRPLPWIQMYRTRDDAIARLAAECRKRRANAVVGLRFDTSQLADGMAQVCAYGTAVYVVRLDGSTQTQGQGQGLEQGRGADLAAPTAELADWNQDTSTETSTPNAPTLVDLEQGRI